MDGVRSNQHSYKVTTFYLILKEIVKNIVKSHQKMKKLCTFAV